MTNNPRTNPAGDGEVIEETEASAGQKTGHMRWVLAIGTILAIGGLIFAWLVM